jgi:hypothetical protein
VVTEPDLPRYGLAAPVRKVTVRFEAAVNGGTNSLLGELEFGSTQDNQTYVRRPDEWAVYAVRAVEFQRLPTAAFQLRDRRIWNWGETNIVRLTIQQGGKTRQLERQGTNSWKLAEGSQGIFNSDAVEEAALRLGQLYAVNWVARGESELARFGFNAEGWQATLESSSGDKLSVRFGGEAPSQLTYAATTLEGQVWIFECPPAVSELARMHLSIPSTAP